ncbi:MAG: MmgE/PrpD family protein [Pseudolabrys sp.]|nr:MmgE/PrpD family protein [Pseudolabrys sp.]MDP2293870.1 MmgE/PrpD family protein [Pseudolabrys sp.]
MPSRQNAGANLSGNSQPGNVSKILADFVVGSRWEDVPTAVRHEAKRSLLNFFGTALGGCRDEAIKIAGTVLSEFSGSHQATIIGRPERTDMLNAAFLNAASSNVFDFDDTHVSTIMHPTAPVAPVLLALAERRRMSGTELLLAFVLGVEVECRIGKSISPDHYNRGWHITATCGVFGATAAAGKQLGLDEQQIVHAFGSASAQASGLVETLGSMAKSVGVGNASRAGLLSALLAERGFTGPDRPFDGQRGFTTVASSNPDLSRITSGLGQDWELLENACKPYPSGVVLFPVIDGCLALRDKHSLPNDQIHEIRVAGNPLLKQRADRPSPKTGREAQVSAQHSAAVALLFGAAGIAEFANAMVNNPKVSELRQRVFVVEDPGISVDAAAISVRMRDGNEFRMKIEHARGSLQHQMTDAEIEQKFHALVAHGCPGCDSSELLRAVWAIDQIDDVGEIMKLARPK